MRTVFVVSSILFIITSLLRVGVLRVIIIFSDVASILTSLYLLSKNPNPTEDEIRWAISGNLCRCTGYNNIVEAIQFAAEKLNAQEEVGT